MWGNKQLAMPNSATKFISCFSWTSEDATEVLTILKIKELIHVRHLCSLFRKPTSPLSSLGIIPRLKTLHNQNQGT